MALEAPKRKADYDEWLEKSIDSVQTHIVNNNDDNLLLIVGDTGSGKSNLALHIMERYLGNKASVDFIGLNKPSIAAGLKDVTEQPLPRCFLVDEANISKRDSLSKFNKDIIDLYSSIRGFQIFHIWCNPSLNMLDKFFIEERIKGIIYCTAKTPYVRVYYYFPKKKILEIFNKYGHLKLPLLYKIRKKYAYYRGWFKEYTGPLRAAYEDKKDNRMTEKINTFYDKWSGSNCKNDMLTAAAVSRVLGLHTSTVYSYLRELSKNGILKEGENFITYPNGRTKYHQNLMPELEKISKERYEKRMSGMK